MNIAEANNLRRAFLSADEPGEILETMQRLDVEGAGELSSKEELDLRYGALRALKRTLPSGVPEIANIITEYLLPLCVCRNTDAVELEESLLIYNCRELADEWLNSLSGEEGSRVMGVALSSLSAALERPAERRGACWTIANIGFRTDALTESLWRIAETGDTDDGALALRTLASLGLEGDQRLRCLERALELVREHLLPDLLGVLAAIPHSQTVSVLMEAWLSRPSSEIAPECNNLLAVFAAIGRSLDEPSAIDRACEAIGIMYKRLDQSFGRYLRLASNVLPQLNSPVSIQLLLQMLTEQTGIDEYDRWLVMHRLEDCYWPRQLESEPVLGEYRTPATEILKEFVLQLGDYKGRTATFPGEAKILGLRTAFFLGLPEIPSWLGEAMVKEQNPFLQQEILEAYAVLKIAPLPDPLPVWITEKKELGTGPGDNAEFIRRMGATRVARSAESWEAFDLLSRPGLTRDGSVMMETAEALVAAALCSGKSPEQRSDVIKRLFDAVEHPTTRAQLSSGCRALAAVARRKWLHAESEQLIALLTVEPEISMEPHDRAELVSAVVALPTTNIPATILDTIADWGRERSDILGERAVRAIVELKKAAEHTEWLAPKLGLSPVGGGWDWSQNASGQLESSVFVIVQLYAQSQAQFTPALCSILKDERWFVRYDAVSALLHLVLHEKIPLDAPVRKALVTRARRRQNTRQSDPELLRKAAFLAPEQFVLEPWSDYCKDWLEDSRVGLANAIGEVFAKLPTDSPKTSVTDNPEPRRQATTHLLVLARDGRYAVRRAAHRALGKVSPVVLSDVCDALLTSHDVQERMLAAEAWAWLPDFAVSGMAESGPIIHNLHAQRFHTSLLEDASKRVRDTAQRAADAKKRRDIARHYQIKLMTELPNANPEMLRSWKFGYALALIGDDDAIRTLQVHLSRTETSPCVRFWLVGLIQQMEKNWSKTMEKWPEPTARVPGGMEVVEAVVRIKGRPVSLNCTLWHLSRATSEDDWRWGGFGVVLGEEAVRSSALLGSEVVISAQNRRDVAVKITSADLDGYIEFRGGREYPSPF